MIKKQPNMNKGALLLFSFFSLLFFILIFRFVTIEVKGEVNGYRMAAKAESQYLQKNIIHASRGKIVDRNGDVIAEDTDSFKLVAILDKKMTADPKHPKHVVDPEKTARELANCIKMKESDIYKQLSQKGVFQVEFGKAGRNLTNQSKKQIEALKLPGIIFEREPTRFYPNGTFASHVIGFNDKKVADDGSTTEEGLGLEHSLNDYLAGQDGSLQFEKDVWGIILPRGKQKTVKPKDGANVYLTIDKKIQTFLEDAMGNVEKQYQPKRIIGIVADPKTGEILAMSQRPTFNPKTREGIEKSWHNEAIETSFEPGSTMKIFTLAAAVEENVFNPNEWYESGSYQATPRTPVIHDHNYVGWGSINFLQGVQRSSNVLFAKLANEKLGFDRYRQYLTKFGLDKPTGIDLPNEATSKIVYEYPIDKVTTAFGQGTAITPIQQVQGATAIANNGNMMKPYVVKEIVDPTTKKVLKKTEPVIAGHPISEKTAKTVRDMLETVVSSDDDYATGKSYRLDGYKVAGKTGTAQITGPNGQYLTGFQNYIFSFLGMAPADDPKLIVYVAVQQPNISGSELGSKPVSMIFNPVMKNSLQYLNIVPGEAKQSSLSSMPNVKGKSVDDAVKQLKEKGFEAIVLGNGKTIQAQSPEENAILLEGEKVLLLSDGALTVPNLQGWSLRDVMKLSDLLRLELKTNGSGYVVKQNLQPGQPLTKGQNLTIELQLPEKQKKKSQSDEQQKEPAKSEEDSNG